MTTPNTPLQKNQHRMLNAGIKLFFALLFGGLALEMGHLFGSKVSEHAIMLLSAASLVVTCLFIISAIASMVATRRPDSKAT